MLDFEVIWNTSHNFSSISSHPGTFIYVTMQNPRKHFLLSCVLKSDKLEWVFQKRNKKFLYC